MVGLINKLRYWIRDIRYKLHQKLLTPKIKLVDLWSLDYTLSKHIALYLKEFKEAISVSGATPAYFCEFNGRGGWQEWSETIDKMAYAFDKYSRHCNDMKHPIKELPEEEQIKIQEGMQLFIKYFHYLNY